MVSLWLRYLVTLLNGTLAGKKTTTTTTTKKQQQPQKNNNNHKKTTTTKKKNKTKDFISHAAFYRKED